MSHRFHTARKANTTARGYGVAHQAERKRRLPLYTPDTLCFAGCGRQLGPDRRNWHLPHNPARTGYLPGFWCADCNRREGAKRGGRIALAKRRGVRVVRRRSLL